jgi:hypothetical protein
MPRPDTIAANQAITLAFFLGVGATEALSGPLLKTNDVVAFVGGEDVSAMQQYGYVEALLAREIAAKNLRFRNLGWEGDTVFEQRRELNFPSWEQTLAKIGATVIVAQYGQAESLRGQGALPHFLESAEKMFTRLAAVGRHLIVIAPAPFERPPATLPDLTSNNVVLIEYARALESLCRRRGWTFVEWPPAVRHRSQPLTRDGLHLNAAGHWRLAQQLAGRLAESTALRVFAHDPRSGRVSTPAIEHLRQAIIAKNQLWFDYWRPQNWAFLAGDRTEQPSSRDHRNPKVRWFPDEMEQFLPLIEAKEREVKALAEKLP